MDITQVTSKLTELKNKQASILAAWRKTGNKELLQFITEFLPASLNAERCGIFVLDPTHSNAWVLIGTYVEERAFTASLESSIVGRTISSGQPILVNDLEDQVGDHYVAGMKTGFITRNALCVPVKDKDGQKTIGAIQLLNKRGAFNDKDSNALNRLAVLVQGNIEQIYQRQELIGLSEEMARHIRHLEGLLIKANLRRKD